MFYSDNGIFLSDKQFKLLNALYKQDLALKDFEPKAGLIYEDWLEILVNENYLDRFIDVTDRNNPLETIFHLNSEGRAIVETSRSRRRHQLITYLFSTLALIISIASLLVSLSSRPELQTDNATISTHAAVAVSEHPLTGSWPAAWGLF